jgi:hypothetical protein
MAVSVKPVISGARIYVDIGLSQHWSGKTRYPRIDESSDPTTTCSVNEHIGLDGAAQVEKTVDLPTSLTGTVSRASRPEKLSQRTPGQESPGNGV